MAGPCEPPITAASSPGVAGLGPGIRGRKEEAQKTAAPGLEFVWLFRLPTSPTHFLLLFFFFNRKQKSRFHRNLQNRSSQAQHQGSLPEKNPLFPPPLPNVPATPPRSAIQRSGRVIISAYALFEVTLRPDQCLVYVSVGFLFNKFYSKRARSFCQPVAGV